MARAPGEAGRDGANHVVTALLHKILDETRTNQRWQRYAIRLQRYAIFLGLLSIALGLLSIALGLLSIAASLFFNHPRELILPFLGSILVVWAITTFVFDHRPERPPGIGTEPDKADEATPIVQADPPASPLDRAVSVAIRLQRQGKNEEAIEKWRAIANVADGTDDELGARAWFSIGRLHGKESRHQKTIADYDQAIRLKPDNPEAYNNRGVAKRHLGWYKEAIADYDQAIRLKPDNPEAYNNRGAAKKHLGRYKEAIADYDEAIQRNPSYTMAHYNRAEARFTLEHKDEALRDFESARALARKAGDEAMADTVSREIERLFGGGDP